MTMPKLINNSSPSVGEDATGVVSSKSTIGKII